MAQAKSKRMTKSQIMGELSERTGMSKKEVSTVFESLRELIKRELGKRGPKEFVIPDMLKLRLRETKPQKNKKIRNPRTGEVTTQDVPARKRLRATPLKKLKDSVLG